MVQYILSSDKDYPCIYGEFCCRMLAMTHSEVYGKCDILDATTGEVMVTFEKGILTYESETWRDKNDR